jgi:hypothetical protein
MRYLALVLALGACAPQPRLQTGPDAEITHDGLTRVEGTVMDAAWLRAGTDLRDYDKVILEGAGIEFRPVKDVAGTRARGNANVFPVTEPNRRKLAQVVSEAFREEVGKSQRFALTDQPGPGVLLVRGALLDVISSVPPESAGRDDIYLSQIGQATLVLELRDSQSGAILARAIDREAAEPIGGMAQSNTVTTWVEVERVADRWGGQLRRGLERLGSGPLGAE